MSMSINNGVVVSRFAGALYNVQLSNAVYNEVLAIVTDSDNVAGQAELYSLANEVYERDFYSATPEAVAATLLANLNINVAGVQEWLAGMLNAAPVEDRGAMIMGLLNGFSTMESDATFGAAAKAYNDSVSASMQASMTPGSVQGNAFNTMGTAGKMFTLTAGTAAGADVMRITGDQDVRIDFTDFNNQVKGLDLDGDGLIKNDGIENHITGRAAGFEIVDAYMRDPWNEYNAATNFYGDISYDGTGYAGDGVNTDGNIFLGGFGADTAWGGIGNDFLAGGGVGARAGGATDTLHGGRNADFMFVELSELDNTDKNVNLDGGNTSDNNSAGSAESAQDSDWLLIEASDDAEPVTITLLQGLSGATGAGSIQTRAGSTTVGTLYDIENVDASGNLYGFLDDVDVQLGGRNTDNRDPVYAAGGVNNGQGATAQLIINGSLEANKLIGGYDNDQILGNNGNDLLMGGNLRSYGADGVTIAQQLFNPNLLDNPQTVGVDDPIPNNGMDILNGGAGSDNIVFEADRGTIDGGVNIAGGTDNDTLWVTDMALGMSNTGVIGADNTLRFDLKAGNAASAGYGGANVAGTQDQTNYSTSTVTGRVTMTNMENVILTGLGAVDFAAAGINNPELTFQNIQNFQRYTGAADLRGTDGVNTLYASSGVDTLEGRGGGAWTVTNAGLVTDTRDMLSGGAAIDTFIFGTMDGAPGTQAAYGDNIDVIWRQADVNGDNLWDGYDHVLGTGGTYEQDFGLDANVSQTASALRLSLFVSMADQVSNPLVGNDVYRVSFTVDGTLVELETAAMLSAATMADLLVEVQTALAAHGDADLTASLSGNTITITDATGRVMGGNGYVVIQNSGASVANVVAFEPTVINTTPDVLLYKAYEDRADNEAVNDSSSNGSTISLGVDSYAEDRVVSFETDAATGRVDTKIAEDQGYRITFDNLTTQDVVTVSVNGVQYTLTVGVDLDGNPIAGEDVSTGVAQLAIQGAFITRLAGHINSFMDTSTAAGQVLAAAGDFDAPEGTFVDGAEGNNDSLTLTQVAYNSEETVFMRTPAVTVANTSGGESVSWQIANLAQHEVTLYGFDGRNGNLNTGDVKFIGATGVTQATLQTAKTAGETIYGNEAVVVDSGANDLAAAVVNTQAPADATAATVADNTNTNPGLAGLNFAVHGDDLIMGGTGNDTLMGRTGDDRILGSLGTDVADGGKNWYAVRVLGETTSRVVEMNAWEAASPAARVTALAGLTISATTQILQTESGAALDALVGVNAFDDTLQFQQEDVGPNARFLVTLDSYQFATVGAGAAAITTIALNQGGAGHVGIDVAGDGAWDAGQVTTFSNFENIRTVSGTGQATAGNGQGFDTLDVANLSRDLGGIYYELSNGALPGQVRYSTDTAAESPAIAGIAQPLTAADYTTDGTNGLIINVDGVENVIGGTGRDYLFIDETEAAKNNNFSASTGEDVIDYQNNIDGTAAGTGEPVVTIKVNTANDTDTVTMTGGRVGTVVATDTLAGVEHILLNNDTAEGVTESDVLDVTMMTGGAIVDYVTGQVRTAGSAVNTNVQVTIGSIEELENVWADGNDTVIVADGTKMNDNERSDEGVDATAAENILFMTYRDFDQLNAGATTRESFASQVAAGTAMTVINQGQFSFKLSEVGTDVDVDRVDYSAENGDIIVPVGMATATTPQYVVVDGDADTAWNDAESRVDALSSVEEVVASLGNSVLDFTNVNAARQISFQYNTSMANPAENGLVESTIRIADGNGNALTGLTGFVEKYTYNKTTPAVADALWNQIEGGDLAELIIYNGSEDLVNQAGLDHRYSNDTLNLRGGNNEVRYSPLETSITAVINITPENLATTAVEGNIAATITFQDGLGGALNANVHNITSHSADNSTAAGTLKIEGSQDAEDAITFGNADDKVFVLGASPGVIEVNINGQKNVTLTGFELLVDNATSNDLYNFSSIANIAGMTFTDGAGDDHDTLLVGNTAINYNAAGALVFDLDNFNDTANAGSSLLGLGVDFDVMDVTTVTTAGITLNGSNGVAVTQDAGTTDEVVIGALSKISNITDFESVVITDATIAEGASFVLDTTADTLTLGAKTIAFGANMNVLSAGGLVLENELGNSYLGSGATSAVTFTATGGDNVTLVGGAGNDTISGAAGNDTLMGGAGNDVLNAGITTEVRVANITGTFVAGTADSALTATFNGVSPITVTEGVVGEIIDGAGNDAVGAALAAKITANLAAINTAAAWAGGGQLVSVAYNATSDQMTFTFNGGVDITEAVVLTVTPGTDVNTLAASALTTSQDGSTGGVNVFRGGAGTDTINGGGVNDTMVVVGSVDAAQATAYGLTYANQAAVDAVIVGGSPITGVVNRTADLTTTHTTTDVAAGDTYNGGAGVDTLHIFGTADMSTSVIGADVEVTAVHSTVTYTAAQLAAMLVLQLDAGATLVVSSLADLNGVSLITTAGDINVKVGDAAAVNYAIGAVLNADVALAAVTAGATASNNVNATTVLVTGAQLTNAGTIAALNAAVPAITNVTVTSSVTLTAAQSAELAAAGIVATGAAGVTVTSAVVLTPADGAIVQATPTAAVDQTVITVTPDNASDADEDFSVDVTIGVTTHTVALTNVAGAATAGTVATALEAAIDAAFAADVSSVVGDVVTVTSSSGTSAANVVVAGTTGTLAGVIATGTDVAQSSTLTLSGTFIEGDTVSVTVTEADTGGVAGTASVYSHTVTAGQTLAQVATALATLVNADGAVDAAAVSGVITVTDPAADDGGFALSALTITNAAQMWVNAVTVNNGPINVDTVVGSVTNYAEVDGTSLSEAGSLAAAQGLLDGTVKYVMVWNANASGDGVLYYDADGANGNETCVNVIGVALAADFAETSIV